MTLFSPKIRPGDVIAVGDIHGRYDLFSSFLNHVRGTESTVVLLGDLIDRGPQSLEVLEKVRSLLDDPHSEGLEGFHCLMGNHEWMMIDAYEGPTSSVNLWIENGADYGRMPEILKHTSWVRELPIFLTIGEILFVHAGIFPGHDPSESIQEGRTESLLWIREPFLKFGPMFKSWNSNLKKVVFGHTPESVLPYFIPEGVCIDTAAYSSGILTSHNVTQNTFWSYEAE